jgi:protein-disulfide isomerase
MSDPTSSKQSFMDRYLTPIAVLLAGVLIAVALVYGHSALQGTQGAAQQQAPAVAVNIKDVKTDNDPFIGSATAPVTMAFWFDYQCPFCKQFETTVTPQLVANYVKTGKVKIVFKDFQFLGNDSISGGEFARAVWELYPDQFYNWYVAMFNAQDQEGDQGFGNQATIVTMTKAQVPAIDTTKVVALIAQKKATYDAAMEADKEEGQKFGIQGTPAFIVGTTLESGAQPYATVAGLIDAQLAGK